MLKSCHCICGWKINHVIRNPGMIFLRFWQVCSLFSSLVEARSRARWKNLRRLMFHDNSFLIKRLFSLCLFIIIFLDSSCHKSSPQSKNVIYTRNSERRSKSWLSTITGNGNETKDISYVVLRVSKQRQLRMFSNTTSTLDWLYYSHFCHSN